MSIPQERDTQKNEVIVDNDTRNGSIYLEMKSRKARWEKTDGYGFAQRKPVYEDGENPFLTGSARFTRLKRKRIRHLPNGFLQSPKQGVTQYMYPIRHFQTASVTPNIWYFTKVV